MATFIALTTESGLKVFNTNRISFVSGNTTFRYKELTTQSHLDTYTVSESIGAVLSHSIPKVANTTVTVSKVSSGTQVIPLADIILLYPDPANPEKTYIKYQASGKREVIHINEGIFTLCNRLDV